MFLKYPNKAVMFNKGLQAGTKKRSHVSRLISLEWGEDIVAKNYCFPLLFDRESYASQAPDSLPSLTSLWRAFRRHRGLLTLRGSQESKKIKKDKLVCN